LPLFFKEASEFRCRQQLFEMYEILAHTGFSRYSQFQCVLIRLVTRINITLIL
jgi:hypothetical protein